MKIKHLFWLIILVIMGVLKYWSILTVPTLTESQLDKDPVGFAILLIDFILFCVIVIFCIFIGKNLYKYLTKNWEKRITFKI